jgi:hypothetical protein
MDRLTELLNEIDDLFRDGYRKNREKITTSIKKIYDTNLVIPFLAKSVSENSKIIFYPNAQSYNFYNGANFYVRVNYWLSENENSTVIKDRVDKYYSIDILHNHWFDFFSLGLFGPGYASNFYHAGDESLAQARIGNVIDLTEISEITLSEGEVIFVSKANDFHIQHKPKSFSLSLNFIPMVHDTVGYPYTDQILVDPVTRIVKVINEDQLNKRDAA